MHLNKWEKKENLYGSLSAEARSKEFKNQFRKLQIQSPILQKYGSSKIIIDILRSKVNCNYDEKDAIIHAIITAVQIHPELRRCGLTLLSLAMWPALEHSYYKLIHLSNSLPDLFAEIYWRFVAEIINYNLAKKNKVAANIQFNMEKRVRTAVKEERYYQNFIRAHAFLDADLDEIMEEPHRNRILQIRQWMDTIAPKEMERCIRRAETISRQPNHNDESMFYAVNELSKVGGLTIEESRLISDHVVRGIKLSEIARRTGISSIAIRVRYHRAKSKLRHFFR